jgi:hypothetical protein
MLYQKVGTIYFGFKSRWSALPRRSSGPKPDGILTSPHPASRCGGSCIHKYSCPRNRRLTIKPSHRFLVDRGGYDPPLIACKAIVLPSHPQPSKVDTSGFEPGLRVADAVCSQLHQRPIKVGVVRVELTQTPAPRTGGLPSSPHAVF